MMFFKKAFIAAGLAVAVATSGAMAQTIAMATDQQGTTFNTVGTGIATVVSANSKIRVIVRPFAGPAAWVPLVNKGEAALGVMSASSAYQAFTGKNEAKTGYRNLRLIRSGSASLQLGFAVRADGPVRSFEDLRGARVSSDFGGHLSIGNSLLASLKIAGLTWNDVVQVPVTGANDGIGALVAGRLDATWASVGQPRAREADTQIGIRFLSVPNKPEAATIYQEMVFPGANVSIASNGKAPGVIGETRLLSYDSYLISGADVADARVTAMLEALWKNSKDLYGIHPSMAGFTPENAVTSSPVLPYHPAAVEFYRARGVWGAADDARQAKLIAEAAM